MEETYNRADENRSQEEIEWKGDLRTSVHGGEVDGFGVL